MIFYEIELLSVPEIVFACSVDVEKCKNTFDNISDFLEICIVEQGRMLHHNFDGTCDTVYPGTISPIFQNEQSNLYSMEGERQRHTTVGVKVSYKMKKYSCVNECNISDLKSRMKEKNIVLIPYRCPIDECFQKSIDTIKSISFLEFSQNLSDRIKAIGKWYGLVGMLSDFVLKKLDKQNNEIMPSEIAYAKKAKDYIMSCYNKKINVADVANHLGVSTGHLHRIFKKAVGMTVVEYINRCKINAAISLIRNRGLSFKDAAYNVGIDDPAYMSRLFKKTIGINYRNYFKEESNIIT